MKIFIHVIIYLYFFFLNAAVQSADLCCSLAIAFIFHPQAQKLCAYIRGAPRQGSRPNAQFHTNRKYSQRPLYETHHMPRYV